METNIKLMVTFGKLSYAFMNSLGKNLEELGMPDSTYPILTHLFLVKKSKIQELGKVASITSGTITHTINKLLKLEYVERLQDTDDKRVFWIQITDKGREFFNKANEEHMKYASYILDDFTEEEKLLFIEQIKYFGKKIEAKVK